MPAKNAIKMRIFFRLLKILSFGGVRKKPSVVFGLIFILLLASAAYYALKYNLSYKPTNKYQYHSQSSVPRNIYSEDVFKPVQSSEENKPTHIYSGMGIPSVFLDNKKPYIAKERIVHLDFKGAPPLKEYLQRLFPMFKNLGATGLLIEYEDMFPYKGSLTDITAYNHYSTKDVLDILSMAESAGLKIIPLVQTLGHMEFALKRPSCQQLRENAESPQALCPSLNASLVFVENMISQIMELHRHRVSHLHIGCDEVFHLGECKLCAKNMNDDGGRYKDSLFLNHVVNVAKIVKRRWPEIRLLIWDDMVRHIPDDLLSFYEIGKYVDPVVWWYTEDVYRFIPPIIWQKYSRVFRTAWTASAFKGAFGETLTVPHARRHLENNMVWLRVMAEQNRYFTQGFAGIMLTGWQRYDHFAVLCELLPASIPSLSLSLLATSQGDINATALYKFGTTLGCPETKPVGDGTVPIRFNLENDPYMWDAMKNCIFPGSKFFKTTAKFNMAQLEATEFIEQIKRHRGWLTDYNIRHSYLPAERAEGALAEDASRILRRLVYCAEHARSTLAGVLDDAAVSEWIEQRPYPLILQIEKIISDASSVKTTHTWPRRPLTAPEDLLRFGQNSDEFFPV